MKNLYIILVCLSVTFSACSKSDKESEPDYTALKQQLSQKVRTWQGNINSKSFSAAKALTVTNRGFWQKTDEAEEMVSDDLQFTYQFDQISLDVNSFSPEQGRASLKGEVTITKGPLKSIAVWDFTATLSSSGDPLILANWSLVDLNLY
jgi:hypothetical protein